MLNPILRVPELYDLNFGPFWWFFLFFWGTSKNQKIRPSEALRGFEGAVKGPRPYPYEVDHAESDFEGPRALGGRFRSILVVFLVFFGYLEKSGNSSFGAQKGAPSELNKPMLLGLNKPMRTI